VPFGLKRDLQIGAILHLFPTRHSLYTIGHSCFFPFSWVLKPQPNHFCVCSHGVWWCGPSSHCSTSATIHTHHHLTAAHCWHVCYNATLCNTLQHTATHCNTLHYTATHLQLYAHIIVSLQHIVGMCVTMQRTATHCNALQRTATHCNALQHTATHCNTFATIHTHHRLTAAIGAHIHVSVPRSLIMQIMFQWVVLMYSKTGHELVSADIWRIDVMMHTSYRVAKTHKMPYLYRSFSTKEPYN